MCTRCTGPRSVRSVGPSDGALRRMVWSKMKMRSAPVLDSIACKQMHVEVGGAEMCSHGGHLHVLQQLLRLSVIRRLDLFVVCERLLRCNMAVHLKPILVKCVPVLLAGNILDRHRV